MIPKKRSRKINKKTKCNDNGERFITDFFKLVDKQSKSCDFKIKTEPIDVPEFVVKYEPKSELLVKFEPESETEPESTNTIESLLNSSISHRIELTDDDEYVQKKGSRKRERIITDYFEVRRSHRRPANLRKEEERLNLERQIINAFYEPDGLAIKEFNMKGRGVVAEKLFNKGDFVMEYIGDLIDMHEARRREEIYTKDNSAGCYMYYFKYNDIQYCIDATEENDTFGRLVNHSRNGNLVTKIVPINNKPRLILFAKNTIKSGEELTYDYGDRSKQSLVNHPWLACCKFVAHLPRIR